MKITLPLFLNAILSASTIVAVPLNPLTREVQLETLSSELVSRADSTVHLTLHSSTGVTYGIDVPLNKETIVISKPSAHLYT